LGEALGLPAGGIAAWLGLGGGPTAAGIASAGAEITAANLAAEWAALGGAGAAGGAGALGGGAAMGSLGFEGSFAFGAGGSGSLAGGGGGGAALGLGASLGALALPAIMFAIGSSITAKKKGKRLSEGAQGFSRAYDEILGANSPQSLAAILGSYRGQNWGSYGGSMEDKAMFALAEMFFPGADPAGALYPWEGGWGRALASVWNAEKGGPGFGVDMHTLFEKVLAYAASGQRITQADFQRLMGESPAPDLSGNWQPDTGRQSGGPVWPGQRYLVGEGGPEVFVPREAGSITPNNQIGAAAGNTVHITIVQQAPIFGFDGGEQFVRWMAAELRRMATSMPGVDLFPVRG
jgi:hypothetical protein